MKDLNYGIIHFDSKDWRGIDVALLFDTTKFIPRKAKAYPLEVEYEFESNINLHENASKNSDLSL